MLYLVLACAIILIGLALYKYRSSSPEIPNLKSSASLPHPADTSQPVLEDQRRILNLQIGDIIDYYDDAMMIESILHYDDEGVVWNAYLMAEQKQGQDRWLSVDDDDRLTIHLYQTLPTRTLDVSDPAPKSLDFDNKTFHLIEVGQARVRRQDQKGTRDIGRCRYADYKGPQDERLSLEWWGQNLEVALGKSIQEESLMIMPGS